MVKFPWRDVSNGHQNLHVHVDINRETGSPRVWKKVDKSYHVDFSCTEIRQGRLDASRWLFQILNRHCRFSRVMYVMAVFTIFYIVVCNLFLNSFSLPGASRSSIHNLDFLHKKSLQSQEQTDFVRHETMVSRHTKKEKVGLSKSWDYVDSS